MRAGQYNLLFLGFVSLWFSSASAGEQHLFGLAGLNPLASLVVLNRMNKPKQDERFSVARGDSDRKRKEQDSRSNSSNESSPAPRTQQRSLSSLLASVQDDRFTSHVVIEDSYVEPPSLLRRVTSDPIDIALSSIESSASSKNDDVDVSKKQLPQRQPVVRHGVVVLGEPKGRIPTPKHRTSVAFDDGELPDVDGVFRIEL